MYSPNVARENFFDLEITDQSDGYIAFRASGALAEITFQYEAGGHRWQRVPPNDKRGRVQTSTTTVMVMEEPTEVQLVVLDKDLEWAFSRGHGAGGQARNKLCTAVDLTHIPTGTTVHCESERSQKQNKMNALNTLRSRLWAIQETLNQSAQNAIRRDQIGTGQRGDKVVTIRYKEGIVTYHKLGQKMSLRDYLAGESP